MELAMTSLQQALERCDKLYQELSHGQGCEAGPVSRRLAEPLALPPAQPGDPEARLAHLVELHNHMKMAALQARRAVLRWDGHVGICTFFEDLQAGHFKAAAERYCRRPPQGSSRMRTLFFVAKRWLVIFWLRNAREQVFRAMSWCCAAMSCAIVLGQMTMFRKRLVSEESWLWYVFQQDKSPWLTQTVCMVPLAYMVYTLCFSIFRLRVPGWYGLYANQNTDMGSLLFCSSLLARLSAPLSYHFLLLVRIRETTFQQFIGKMSVVPVLGESFNDLFPCIVAVLCLINILNVYDKLVACLSLGSVDFEGTVGEGSADPLSEGQQLIQRERRVRAEEAAENCPARENLSVPLSA